jgi:hypothetical protein
LPLAQDLRYALRQLRKNPGLTAVAVIMLALGIGANTAIFSLVDAVLLRPLPFPNPERLVFASETAPMQVGVYPKSLVSRCPIRRKLSAVRVLSSISVGTTMSAGYIGKRDGSEQIAVTYASDGLLESLGVQYLGSPFTPADDQAGAGRTALLSCPVWQARLGGDPQVVGRTVIIDGKRFTVAGVLPHNFWFVD